MPTLTGTNTFSGANTFSGTVSGLQITRTLIVKAIFDTDALTTGDGQTYITVPSEYNGMHLTVASAHVYTASTSGTPTVQIAKASIADYTTFVDMLTTRITIDENEYDSAGATAPVVINTTYYAVATSNILRIDVDVAGTGTKGMEVCLQFQK